MWRSTAQRGQCCWRQLPRSCCRCMRSWRSTLWRWAMSISCSKSFKPTFHHKEVCTIWNTLYMAKMSAAAKLP